MDKGTNEFGTRGRRRILVQVHEEQDTIEKERNVKDRDTRDFLISSQMPVRIDKAASLFADLHFLSACIYVIPPIERECEFPRPAAA